MLLITVAVILNGCSSGSDSSPAVATAPTYSGNTSPAAITSTNAKSIGVISTEAANEAISADKGSKANPFAVSIVDNASFAAQLSSITRSLLDNAIASDMPIGATLSYTDLGPDFCGGNVTIPDSAFNSGLLNGSFTYNNLCYDDGSSGQIIVNGTVAFTETTTEITMTYLNFTVTTGGETQNFNATITCDTSFLNCTFSSTFVGSDGSVHSIEDYTVIDTGTGFDVSATFFHHTYGIVTITTTAELTFGTTCGVFPDGGEIYISSSTGSFMYVSFANSCMYSITGNDGSAVFGPITGSQP
jgi:hypothetical protein